MTTTGASLDRVNQMIYRFNNLQKKNIFRNTFFEKNIIPNGLKCHLKTRYNTSSPFCFAGQFDMAREPQMKSFCTSTIMIAVRGLTI